MKKKRIMMNNQYKFTNTPLPYAYNALEPYIDARTMMLHHQRHLQSYIDNLNAALKDYPQYQDLTLAELILHASQLPPSIRLEVYDNAGGVFNHRFYFSIMGAADGQKPSGMLGEAIDWTYGSYYALLQHLKKAALSLFGSGYAWLVANYNGGLEIITTPNQDTPLPCGLKPLLNLDVWEHAYYLKHYNERASYIDDWFHVVNWKQVSENYLAPQEAWPYGQEPKQ